MDTRKCLPKQHNDDGDPPIPATPLLPIPEKVSIAEDISPSLPMESGNTKEVQGGLEKSRKRKRSKYVDTANSNQGDVTKVSGLATKQKVSSPSVNDDWVLSKTGISSVKTPPITNTKTSSGKGIPCASVDAEDFTTLKPGGRGRGTRGGPVADRSEKLDCDEANVDGEDAIEGKSDSYTKQVEKIATPKASPHNEEKKVVSGDESVAESISTTGGVSPAKPKKEIVSSLQPWTEKYTPKIPEDVIGNKKTVKYLYKWLKNWKNNFLNEKVGKQKDQWAKKAVLLTGAPGIGKTTSAKFVSQMLGFRTIELNASDNRGKADPEIEERTKRRTAISLKELVNNQFLSFSRKRSKHPNVVLIMDEVDAMVAADNGGIADLISSIKVSKIPIICICNDQYNQKLKGLVRFCSILGFQKPTNQMMANRLKEIANSEGVQVAELALVELAHRVDGDMRMALNQLQYMSLKSDIKVVGSNDTKGLFTSSTDHLATIDKLFVQHDYDLNIDEQLELSAIDAEFVALNVQENYINYRPNEDLTDEKLLKKIKFAADSISSGDIMDVQMTRYQKRQLFQSRCLTTSVIPAAHLRGERNILKRGENNLNRFGGWLEKESKMEKNYRLLKDISLKFNISRSTMCLDYPSPLLENIVGQQTLPSFNYRRPEPSQAERLSD